MIELNRYARVKPAGLVRAEPTEDGGGLNVFFKRFDVETGREIDPETSFMAWAEMEDKLREVVSQEAVLRELLSLRGPKENE